MDLSVSQNGWTALLVATKNGHTDDVQRLLGHVSHANAENEVLIWDFAYLLICVCNSILHLFTSGVTDVESVEWMSVLGICYVTAVTGSCHLPVQLHGCGTREFSCEVVGVLIKNPVNRSHKL